MISLSASPAYRISPASGTSSRPIIDTGVDGNAEFTRLPLSSVIALILPVTVPTIIESPTLNVPFWIRTFAIGPLLWSSFASITTPFAFLFGLALRSLSSASRLTFSKSVSIPAPVFAEIGQTIVSPPHSSGSKPFSVKPVFTLSRLASGLSILLTATIIGTSAAFAWLIASIVCGIIPSSAATTKIAISVACAPRARIDVNAA